MNSNVHITEILSDQEFVDAVQPISESASNGDDEEEEDEYSVFVSNKEAKIM